MHGQIYKTRIFHTHIKINIQREFLNLKVRLHKAVVFSDGI